MKNKISILLSVIVLFAIQSCTKQNQNITVTQTVSAKISANETYTYTLPTNVSSHDFQISVSGNHSSVSAIQKDASGNLTYIYTPALNYTGADQIVLSTNIEVAGSTEHHDNCSSGNHDGNHPDNDGDGDHHGEHPHHENNNREHGHQDADKNMVITINLTVTPIANSVR